MLRAILVAIVSTLSWAAAEEPPANLAPFGFLSLVSTDGARPSALVPALTSATNASSLAVAPDQRLLIEWQHPRPVRQVVLRFAGPVPVPREVRLEWWQRIWPDGGEGGWMRLDDPFNGSWVRAFTEPSADTNSLRLNLAPLSSAELAGVQRSGLTERVTYRLRLGFAKPVQVEHLAVHSDAVERMASLRFEWAVQTTVPGEWDPRFEVRNGQLHGVRKAGPRSAIVDLTYADAENRLSPDRGYVVFRNGEVRSFSVFVDDVLRDGGLYVRDIGVFVSDATKDFTFDRWPGATGEIWAAGTVMEQVASLPEQSFAAASAAMPAKSRPYLMLGVPNLRQEIALLPDGDLELRADALRSPGPDADRRARPWSELTYDFETGDRPVMGVATRRNIKRQLEEGWLPVVRHEWTEGAIACEQTSLAAPLLEDIAKLDRCEGTEPVVLATRFQFRNPTAETQSLSLWLELSRPLPMHLAVDNTMLSDRASDRRLHPGLVPVRGHFNLHQQGSLELAVLEPAAPGSHNPALAGSAQAREAIRYRLELPPDTSHAIEFFVPYLELLNPEELSALKALSFTNLHATTTAFWKQRVTQGMTLEVPEPWLNHFFKANLWHVLISTDIDPATGLHQHGAATHGYGNFLNETAMVARSLEMRGEHDAAIRLLEPFIVSQGHKALPGNFRSSEAVFYAAYPHEPDPYTALGYNLHHGFGMWAVAEHFAWSRDHNYLLSVAPRLIGAADWVTRERAATRFSLPDGRRPVEFGLAPAGELEDVEEFHYWYANNAYFHLGMTHVVNAVGALSLHPATDPTLRRRLSREVIRLNRDTVAFAADIRASVAESVATTPVVRLRDGHYIPHVPPRAYALTDRQEGWIREALYPALHLVNGGLYEANHPFVGWMVQNLEDNLLLSKESGVDIALPREHFFNLGGFTRQPMLLDLPLVYLQRDRVANFLRGFYNSAAASLYPDAMCFAEWVPRLGQGGGPLYKTPDECKFIQWLRQMLICERNDRLELGLGVPRAWMADGQVIRVERAATYFGRVNLEITSRAAEKRVLARVVLEPTVTPRAIMLRLRDVEGRSIKSATVNKQRAKLDRTRQTIELSPGSNTWEVEARF